MGTTSPPPGTPESADGSGWHGRSGHGRRGHGRSGHGRQGWDGRHGREPGTGHRSSVRLALLIALVQIVGTSFTARGQVAELDPLGYGLLAISALALAVRRRQPIAAVVLAAAPTVAYHVLDYPRGPTFVALIIAGVVAVKAGHRYPVWAVTAAGYAVWVVLTEPTLHRAAVLLAWVAGLLLLAEWARAASQHRAQQVQMNQERARAHEEQERRQASEERLRIAQELHDVLGHHLSLINVQAGVGLHLMDSRPEQARAALGTIKQASAEALREVRSVLAALDPDGAAAPRTPAPGLDRLSELTADAGLAVATEVRGTPRPLPAELDRAAYRIVQEALTNVRRHAGAGATATVVIEYGEEELVVQVDDDGGTDGAIIGTVTEGTGIGGMRERAAALGGSLTAQAHQTGGFRVRARLPLPPPPDGAA